MARRLKRRRPQEKRRPPVDVRKALAALTDFDVAAAKLVEAQARVSHGIEHMIASTDLDPQDTPLTERFHFEVGHSQEGAPRAFQLILPEFPPRLEVHWQALPTRENYKAVRDRWFSLVRTAIHTAKAAGFPLPTEPLGRVLVEIKTCFGSALSRDPDNYTAKFIIDALRQENILKEDTIEEVQVLLRGSKEGPPRTEILVAEIWDQHDALIAGVKGQIRRIPFAWDAALHRYKPLWCEIKSGEDRAHHGSQETSDLENHPENLP